MDPSKGINGNSYGLLPPQLQENSKFSKGRYYTCCGGKNVITWKKYNEGYYVVDHVGPFGKKTMKAAYPDCMK